MNQADRELLEKIARDVEDIKDAVSRWAVFFAALKGGLGQFLAMLRGGDRWKS